MNENLDWAGDMAAIGKYRSWMQRNVPQSFDGQLAECTRYVPLMAQVFLELIVCKGVVFSKVNIDNISTIPDSYKEYPHMWLKTKEGVIIDPTIKQFDALGKLEYREFPKEATALSRCCNCGKYFTTSGIHGVVCSHECQKEYAVYLAKSRYNSWGMNMQETGYWIITIRKEDTGFHNTVVIAEHPLQWIDDQRNDGYHCALIFAMPISEELGLKHRGAEYG